ncbi:MAG: carbonic anhydrase [Ignavibacteriaceae bacterium]
MERVREIYKEQHPFAVILSCSDSRVPPEVIFDEGLGDLFVIRVAGNVADEVVMGSIEYAAKYLAAPLVLVMGHEHCGAVHAALEPGEYGENINRIIEKIAPAVEKTKSLPGDHYHNAVVENIKIVKTILEEDPELKPFVMEGKLKIVSGIYNLGTGEVEIFTD